MTSLQDISNYERSVCAPAVTKTFERRKKAQQQDDPPQTPLSQACSTSPISEAPTECSSSASSLTRQHDTHTRQTGRSTALHRGRRSSILHAAAVPGHERCREVPASRSLLLQKMSKAKLKAYMAYTKQMAEYFAEVDEFELIEESVEEDTAQTAAVPQQQTGDASASLQLHSPEDAAAAGDEGSYESDLACQTPMSTYSPDKVALATTQPVGSSQRQTSSYQSAPMHETDVSARYLDWSSRQQAQSDVSLLSGETPLHEQLLSTTPQSTIVRQEHVNTRQAHTGPAEVDKQRQEELVPSPPNRMDAREEHSPPGKLACSQAAGEASCSSAATVAGCKLYANSPATVAETEAQDVQSDVTGTASLIAEIEQLSIQGKDILCSPEPAVTPAALEQLVTQQDRQPLQESASARQQQLQEDLQQAEQQQAAVVQQQTQPSVQEQQPLYDSAQLQQLDEQQLQQMLQELAANAAAQKLAALELAAMTPMVALTPLQRMLQACGQQVELDQIPCMKDFMSDVTDMKEIIKLGEGTYGEAFKSPATGVVFKLVPMEGDNLINGYEQKKAADLLAEAIIASTLSGLTEQCDPLGHLYPSHTNAFVKTYKVGVCRGPYPQPFIKAWKAWDKRNKSENDPINQHPQKQLYAVFAMADCGKDLESYQLRDFNQARSMMFQVAMALAIAEDCLAFEHRDLHWGNVMLSPAPSTYIHCRLRGCSLKVRTEGSVVSLIDFTASRLQTPAGDVAFCDLEAEDGLFDGPKGKPQFETYRRMRKLTKGDWAGSHPKTNVMWMLYLAELLLSSDKPITGATAAQKRQLREFKKRVVGYSCCGEVIWDELFQGLWAVVDS